MSSDNRAPSRRRRVTYACDFCHRRGIRCKPAQTLAGDQHTPPCQTCIEFGQHCTRTRPPKKRGTKPQARKHSHTVEPVVHDLETFTSADNWAESSLASSLEERRAALTALLRIYLDTIHPIFPLYCERNLWLGWRDSTFPSSQSEYRAVLCMCALGALHADKGALFTENVSTSLGVSEVADSLLREAESLLPQKPESPDLDLARCYGFLALIGTQLRKGSMTQLYLGLYHGLAAQLGLHDETRWVSGLSPCDCEVRRRIWWAMYRLEVHTSCILGSIIRSPEAHSNVGYPTGLHHPAFVPGRDGDFEDWFSGWNLTTDLYRILEHAISEFRARKKHRGSVFGAKYVSVPSSTVEERLAELQHQLMPQFQAVHSRSNDSGRNRCGFQASTILCTIHLARMISSITSDTDFPAVCETVSTMIDHVKGIPLEYVRATGSLMIQQLAGVGHMLISLAGKRQLSQSERSLFSSVIDALLCFLRSLHGLKGEAAAAGEQLAHQLEGVALLPNSPTGFITPKATGDETCFLDLHSWLASMDGLYDGLDAEGDVFTRNLLMSFDFAE